MYKVVTHTLAKEKLGLDLHPVGRNPGRSIVVLYLPPNIISGPGGFSKVTPTPPREHDVDLRVPDSRPVPHSYRISCACALDDECLRTVTQNDGEQSKDDWHLNNT